MSEPAWRRRYRAPRTTFPTWARDRADRLVYVSNRSGTFEVFAWDRERDVHRQVTDRPEGTGFRVAPRVDPGGERVWWWDDRKGDEFGTWVVEGFDGGDRHGAAPLEPSYSAGLALGRSFAVVGRSTGDEGSTAYVVSATGATTLTSGPALGPGSLIPDGIAEAGDQLVVMTGSSDAATATAYHGAFGVRSGTYPLRVRPAGVAALWPYAYFGSDDGLYHVDLRNGLVERMVALDRPRPLAVAAR